MRSHRLAITCLGAGLLSACSVPLERFDRPDAGPGDDADADASPPPFVPIHVLPETMIDGAPDLVLSATPTSIDTTALTIDGATNPYFVRQGDSAILFAGELSVRGPVKVTGLSPLIVVASGRVTISSSIALGAVGRAPGPGAAADNPGGGGPGQSEFLPGPDVRASSGGGGASYGTLGARGGGSAIPPGSGGVRYGMLPADPLTGGSKGGDGGFSSGSGGAGGGALQIPSAISIGISGPGGLIEAGGGGGAGGRNSQGGAGGGAGGEILLEAPSIEVAGVLAANGGGGGGGGPGDGVLIGIDGQDALALATPASGGAGAIPQGSDGGAGAAGAEGSFAEAQPGGSYNSKGGGGGGGAGRIWLRHRAATPPTLAGAVISPPAGLDPTLP